MREFNLAEALAGKPVVTAWSAPVEQLKLFNITPTKQMLAGIYEQRISTWEVNGHFTLSHHPSYMDLHMVGEKKKAYILVWKLGRSWATYISDVFFCKLPEAWTVGFKTTSHSGQVKELIAITEVEWEE